MAESVASRGLRRVAILLGLLAVGLAIGTLGAFVQADRWLIGSVPIPWGAVLVVGVLVVVERGATWAVMSRWGAWLVFGGWLVGSLFFAADGPNGDLAISGGGRQMGYLIVAVVLGSAVATIRVPRTPTPTGHGADPTITPAGERAEVSRRRSSPGQVR